MFHVKKKKKICTTWNKVNFTSLDYNNYMFTIPKLGRLVFFPIAHALVVKPKVDCAHSLNIFHLTIHFSSHIHIMWNYPIIIFMSTCITMIKFFFTSRTSKTNNASRSAEKEFFLYFNIIKLPRLCWNVYLQRKYFREIMYVSVCEKFGKSYSRYFIQIKSLRSARNKKYLHLKEAHFNIWIIYYTWVIQSRQWHCNILHYIFRVFFLYSSKYYKNYAIVWWKPTNNHNTKVKSWEFRIIFSLHDVASNISISLQ